MAVSLFPYLFTLAAFLFSPWKNRHGIMKKNMKFHFFYRETYVVGIHLKHLFEMLQMPTHNQMISSKNDCFTWQYHYFHIFSHWQHFSLVLEKIDMESWKKMLNFFFLFFYRETCAVGIHLKHLIQMLQIHTNNQMFSSKNYFSTRQHFSFVLEKSRYGTIKKMYNFFFSICCGYVFEASHWGASSKYQKPNVSSKNDFFTWQYLWLVFCIFFTRQHLSFVLEWNSTSSGPLVSESMRNVCNQIRAKVTLAEEPKVNLDLWWLLIVSIPLG